MKLNIEQLDWWIWLVIIIPAVVLVGFWLGWESSAVLILMVPVLLLLKNMYLERRMAWKPEYSVKVAVLDEDHKKLLALTWKLFKSLNSLRSKDEAAVVMKELADYTIDHFGREEALMEQHGFPGLAGHRKEHEDMVRKIREASANFETNSLQASREVLHFLQDWLVNHINVTDKGYSDFLNGKGVR